MDKGYYDYDYSEIEKKSKAKSYDESVKSDAEIRNKLKMFGWGIEESMTAEELQSEVMKDINSRKAQK